MHKIRIFTKLPIKHDNSKIIRNFCISAPPRMGIVMVPNVEASPSCTKTPIFVHEPGKIDHSCLILKKVDSQTRVNYVSFTHGKTA